MNIIIEKFNDLLSECELDYIQYLVEIIEESALLNLFTHLAVTG